MKFFPSFNKYHLCEAEDEMVRQHHQLNSLKFEQTLGDSGEQRSLACCSPWGCQVGHNLATKQQQHIILKQIAAKKKCLEEPQIIKPQAEKPATSV